MPSGSVKILTQGQTLVVDLLGPAGASVSAWSDAALTSTLSLPATISSDTTIYVRPGNDLTLSIKKNDLEIASEVGTTRLFRPQDGQQLVISPTVNPGVEAHAQDFVTSAVATATFETIANVTAGLAAKAPVLSTGEHPVTGMFHVKGYGAVGDGTTDDTAAIQAALDAAAAAGDGVVVLDSRTYKLTAQLTVSGSRIKLQGATARGTKLMQVTLNTGILRNTGSHNEFRDLRLEYSGAPASGATAFYSSGPNTIVDSVYITNCHTGMSFTAGSAQMVSNFQIFDYTTLGVLVQDVNDVFFSKFIINANAAAGSLGGIRLVNFAEAIIFTDGDVLNGAYSLTAEAGTYGIGTRPAYNSFTSVYFDSATNGVLLNEMVETTFVGCWFSGGRAGAGNAGCVIQDCDSLTFSMCRWFNNGGHGCQVTATCKRLIFSGCMFESNSVTAGVGVRHGLVIAANTTDFVVTNCIAHNGLYTGQQGYGILLNAGTSDRYVIADNLVSGNATAGVSDGGSGANKRVANNY